MSYKLTDYTEWMNCTFILWGCYLYYGALCLVLHSLHKKVHWWRRQNHVTAYTNKEQIHVPVSLRLLTSSLLNLDIKFYLSQIENLMREDTCNVSTELSNLIICTFENLNLHRFHSFWSLISIVSQRENLLRADTCNKYRTLKSWKLFRHLVFIQSTSITNSWLTV